MRCVGLRELKDHLAEYVRDVRAGEAVLVTDRGTVVAELIPPGHFAADAGTPAALVALAIAGQSTLGMANVPEAYPKLPRLLKRGRVSQLLQEERGLR